MLGKEFILFLKSGNPRRAKKGFLAFTLFDWQNVCAWSLNSWNSFEVIQNVCYMWFKTCAICDSKHVLYVERWFQYKDKNPGMFCSALKVIWKIVGVRSFWNRLGAYWELGEQFTKQWKLGSNYCSKLHC